MVTCASRPSAPLMAKLAWLIAPGPVSFQPLGSTQVNSGRSWGGTVFSFGTVYTSISSRRQPAAATANNVTRKKQRAFPGRDGNAPGDSDTKFICLYYPDWNTHRKPGPRRAGRAIDKVEAERGIHAASTRDPPEACVEFKRVVPRPVKRRERRAPTRL